MTDRAPGIVTCVGAPVTVVVTDVTRYHRRGICVSGYLIGMAPSMHPKKSCARYASVTV